MGRPDPARELRLRTVTRTLLEPLGLALSAGDTVCSSGGPASFFSADCLREWRVMVFASGDSSTSFFFAGALSAGARAVGARMALVRRAAVSFFFVAFSLSFSFESLCMTSAMAFPTEERPKDWRIELRVVGLDRVDAPLADVAMAGRMEAYICVARVYLRVVLGYRDGSSSRCDILWASSRVVAYTKSLQS